MLFQKKLDGRNGEAWKLHELKNLTDSYFSRIEEYSNLETDYLLSNIDLRVIEEKIKDI